MAGPAEDQAFTNDLKNQNMSIKYIQYALSEVVQDFFLPLREEQARSPLSG